MTSETPEVLVEFAVSLAEAAGAVARRYFRTPLNVDDKADLSPVTRADREAEQAIRSRVADRYPDHGLVGEEEGPDRPEADYVWVVDPIDGTRRFITGNPLFGTLVALLHNGNPVIGIIELPALGERWIGAKGRETLFQDAAGPRPAKVRACERLSEATLSASSPHMFSAAEFPAFERVRKACKSALYGGDCFNYGALANGYQDLVVEADMDPYDYLALVPVVEGAGGIMSDWTGAPLRLGGEGRVIAAGDPRVHAESLALLAET